MSDKRSSFSSWKHYFDRRERAARDGRHLPSTQDLSVGMAFFENDLRRDAQIWAERLLLRLGKSVEDPDCENVVIALKRLTVSPDLEDFKFAQTVLFEREVPAERWLSQEEVELRFTVYRASLGDHHGLISLCTRTSQLLLRGGFRSGLSKARICMLLGLSAYIEIPSGIGMTSGQAMRIFRKDGEEIVRQLEVMHDHATRQEADSSKPDTKSEPEKQEDASELVSETPGKIVFSEIGNPKSHDADHIYKIVKPLVGKRLPLREVPDLSEVRGKLMMEFPHAIGVIDTIINHLAPQPSIAMRPTILVGSPGCGKTTFAIRLAELLALPSYLYGCAGASDSSFAGTASRWSSSEPALPVSAIISAGVANPMIILDELEKASKNRRNGSLFDGLLPMLEPRSAKIFFDLCVQAPVDISGVVFFGTVNDATSLPMPLRDRCRILAFPSPEPRHITALVPNLLDGVIATRCLDRRWVQPLAGDEIEALASAWPGGSLRSLQRLIEGVLDARDQMAGVH